MKMICPHCGVKGSADDALLGRKVQCPECMEIFEVQAEVVESIDVEDLELEQLPDPVGESFDAEASEEEIEDVFSKLLSGESQETGGESFSSEFDSLTSDAEEGSGEDDVIAALSSAEDDIAAESELLGEEQQDETLTIIEDFPEEVMLDEADALTYEVEEEDELTVALDTLDETEEQEEFSLEEEDIEESEESLDFEEGFLDDEPDDQETVPEEEESGTDDDLPDELFDDEPEIELDADDEPDITLDADDDLQKDDEVTGDWEEEEEEEVDSGESADREDNILSASFLDDDFDEQLDEEEDEPEESSDVLECSACGQSVDPEEKHESGGNVYCSKCVPNDIEITKDDEELVEDGEPAFSGFTQDAEQDEFAAVEERDTSAVGRFTVTTLIKDAWHYSHGAKGAIWAGIGIMYATILALVFAVIFFGKELFSTLDPMTAILISGGGQVLASFCSYIFVAGIIMIAVNRVGHQHFSWKMVFSGFKKIGSMIVLLVLQMILLTIGFCLFIIPGIYLSVGYILAIPLVFVKGLSPWKALETSRKAVHERWWTVFFALIVMNIIISISSIPLGLGLIWTVPMFVVMIGVLFHHLCGADDDEDEEEAFELESFE